MAAFPKLKTNVVTQYPATKTIRFRNQVLQFVDGTEQRYRDSQGSLREWDIRLSQLDEREMAEINQFFTESQGCFGNFEFTDPWDGQFYPSCSFASDNLTLTFIAEMQGQLSLKVVENRS